ncbi:MAG: chemotaxis response regulator protein-glutamate methylesterase [Desulfobacterales bacterium]|nr:chemotaxis response regulator protein-glutamate methylesterase [Desulfobacterales bacterium]
MANSKLRILVVDDTVVYRTILSNVVTELPGAELAGVAHNGRIAMSKITSLKPDLLLLDIEMPEMNGLEVLAEMRGQASHVGAIVVSMLTNEGGEMTIKALELGAFDFICKPQHNDINKNKKAIKNTLAPMIKSFVRMREIKSILEQSSFASNDAIGNKKQQNFAGTFHRNNSITAFPDKKSAIVAIGISTGGPKALIQMMPEIPHNLGVPILIVQHMPPFFTKSLANSLDSKCSIKVKEAQDGEIVQSNTALIAPGGKQMKIEPSVDRKHNIIRITDDPPENSCKPSADYLFRSIANHYAGRATGVIMTGMGSDGANGLKLMKQNGAFIVAQDEKTSIIYGMPKKAIESGIVDVVAPLDAMAEEICRTVR